MLYLGHPGMQGQKNFLLFFEASCPGHHGGGHGVSTQLLLPGEGSATSQMGATQSGCLLHHLQKFRKAHFGESGCVGGG